MLTRVILAAGVAALAIAAPASAERGGKGGGDQERATKVERGGGERAQRSQRVERRAARAEQRARPQQLERRSARLEQRSTGAERRAARLEQRSNQMERRVARLENRGAERKAVRVEQRANRAERRAERLENRGNRLERRANRIERAERRELRQQIRNERIADVRELRGDRVRVLSGHRGLGWGVGGCPPGLDAKDTPGCLPPGQVGKAEAFFDGDAFRTSRLARLTFDRRTRFLAPTDAVRVLGLPLSTANTMLALQPMPQTVSYLYPDTDDYYYRYGGGYVYRVDRDNDLISWILPLLAGGLLPGQYLPATYMSSSYVPDYYGFNSFYPTAYPNSPYDCHRYVNGVIYEVDCVTGLIEDVIPLYASGYGVGQMLPASYGYYNVPNQYRSLYYNTPDYNYWYSPGAIYQVDPTTSLITSVAALLSPGLTIGQPLPMGYSTYNVPLSYRSMYYDTPSAWYRYNNGYIYQVDPVTQLVTAIVASVLT